LDLIGRRASSPEGASKAALLDQDQPVSALSRTVGSYLLETVISKAKDKNQGRK